MSFAIAVFALTVVMLGTTLPTPLYPIYGDHLGFGVLTTTVVYAVYATGVAGALILFGRFSDILGRKPLLLAGALLSVASALVFVTAGELWQLILGRVLSGLSAGIYAGAATAAVIEAAPLSWRGRAAALATAANVGGTGIGPLLSGFLAQYGPVPLRAVFVVNLVLLAVVMVGIWWMAEPLAHPSAGHLAIQRLSVPHEIRSAFARASIVAFAGFSVAGSFAGVAPAFVSQVVGIQSPALVGILVATLLLMSAAVQIAGRGLPADRAMVAGCIALVVGVAILIGGLATRSLILLVLGAVVSGAGQGLTFSKGLAALVAVSPQPRRAEVISAYFLVVYVAISLPIVGVGLAASRWGLQVAGVGLNVVVGVLALVALALTVASSCSAGQHRSNQDSDPMPG
ncbi:MFS transporter [Gordonia humi]|uniref:MFS family permease n=1 Tax=Gordonia humi TaxID=686429 RepID=A0A840F2S7_9ACTN|nr:MFS family permease [Gordonia humi]